jgi:drug/metabolite transporter (DMT)-like permease
MPNTLSEQNLTKGVALGVLTVFFGSTVGAAAKHLTSLVDISAIIFFQYLICLACLAPWLLRKGRKELKTDYPWHHVIRGVSGCACFYTYYVALKYISLVDATLLRNTAPLVVPLVIWIWLGIGVPKVRWIPLIIGFVGVAVVLIPGHQGVNEGLTEGVLDITSNAGLNVWHLVGFCSGVGLAISMVSTRLLATHEPESRILFYYFLISLLFAVPFFILNYQPIPKQAIPWLIYIGVMMYLAFALYTRAYTFVKASVLAPTSYFAVVFSGALDWIIWENIPDIWTISGTALIVLGGLLILWLGTD